MRMEAETRLDSINDIPTSIGYIRRAGRLDSNRGVEFGRSCVEIFNLISHRFVIRIIKVFPGSAGRSVFQAVSPRRFATKRLLSPIAFC